MVALGLINISIYASWNSDLLNFFKRKTEELTDIELNDEQVSTIESEKEEQETVDNTKVIQLEKEIETLQVL